MASTQQLNDLTTQVRRDILRMVHKVNSGHPGGSLGCAEFFVALYSDIMQRHEGFDMDGQGEDLFFLSNGHISPVYYSVLARTGYFEVNELNTFRLINSRLQGHPTTHEGLEGIRVATGSLGQGFSVAVGHAKQKKMDGDDGLVYVVTGDGELQEGQKDLVISGMIDGIISGMQFTNSRGQPGKALRMRLKGKDNTAMRVVLWGKDESLIPNMISQSANVKLLGVRVKSGNQGLEIHGNEATIIEIEGGKEAEPIITRILSIATTETGKNMIIAVDNKKNIYNISDFSNSTSICVEGDVIECMPSKVYGNSVTLDENSFVRKLDNDETIPSLSKIRTKISDVKADGTYCIESIVLKVPGRKEIQTKSGESISLSEMFVEDDTGQIWVKGWRIQAKLIDKCELGEIIAITGLNAKINNFGEGRIELFLTAHSKIIKKN